MFLGTTKRSPRIVLSYDLASQILIDSTTAQDFDYRVVQTVGNKERRGSSPFRRFIPNRYIARCKARIVPHFRAVECQRICSPDY
jgi:hypothetical protein